MSREMVGAYRWQYNGVAPWDRIHIWCLDNLRYCWHNGFDTFHFDDHAEYVLFLLKWGR